MVMKPRVTTARAPRRVALKRSKKKADNKYHKKIVPPQRKAPKKPVKIPWSGIGKTFSLAGVSVVLLALVAVLSVGLLAGYRFVISSAYFSLKTIEIQGNSRLTSKEILETVKLDTPANTLAISIDEIEGTLLSNPWVSEVSVQRVLPDSLIIRLKEKQPCFWVLGNDILHYADERGKIIAPVAPGHFAALPVLEVEPGAEEATVALPALVKSFTSAHLPPDMTAIARVRLSAAKRVEVFVDKSKLSFSIGLEEWLANLDRLSRTVADLNRRGELENIREIKAEGSNVWVVKAS